MAHSNDIISRVKRLLGPHVTDDHHLDSAIGLLMEDGLLLLGRQAAGQQQTAHYFRFPLVTPDLGPDGAVDITTLTDSTTDNRLLLDSECVEKWLVIHQSSDTPMQRAEDYWNFSSRSQMDSFYLQYFLEGKTIKTKSTDRNATFLAGPLVIHGSTVPVLANVEENMAQPLVEILFGLFKGTIPRPLKA